MTQRNENLQLLSPNYLFPEINRRKQLFLEQFPQASLISLGIGDTTEPLPLPIYEGLATAARQLGTQAGYRGYGPEQGYIDLRARIAARIYHNHISADDIFISDGAKCDIGRLQQLFGSQLTVAVQDPAYPVYVDGSLIQGVRQIFYLACTPENNFWPDWKKVPRTDLIYICSPNNPTGTVATRKQLEELVSLARKNRSIIIFDAAYGNYIKDPSLPCSIFEIEGADEVAIEVNSFSKLSGFTGVRLGWTVVKEALKYDDGASVKADWKRVISTIFNGASNISQAGGLAVLSDSGLEEIKKLTSFYLENAALIKEVLVAKGWQVFGGDHAPFLWVRFSGRDSWDIFQELLSKAHIISTPGSGFGRAGSGFIRFSAFGHRDQILKAIERLKTF